MADSEQSSSPSPPRLIEWRPQNVPHVLGRYTSRVVDETGLPEPQDFTVVCEKCLADNDPEKKAQATWKGSCSSGNVRRHIQQFAARHQHRDVLEAPRIVRPGSLRSDGSDQ